LSGITELMNVAGRHKLLTAAQENTLGRAIRTWQDWPDGPDEAPRQVRMRGKRALDRFVVANIRLAYTVAKKYENHGVPLEDLTQSAIEGLISAYRRFNPELGYRSSSYAIWYAKQSCQLAVQRQGSSVRLPMSVITALSRISVSKEVLTRQLRRPPTQAEIAAQANLPEAKVCRAMDLARIADASSLDAPLRESDSTGMLTLGEALPGGDDPQHVLENAEHIKELLCALDHLGDPLIRVILWFRHLDEERPSLSRIAQLLHLNPTSIRTLEAAGLQALRPLVAHAA
jgi:RNA polymerase sigma factor (sigma-70 family)